MLRNRLKHQTRGLNRSKRAANPSSFDTSKHLSVKAQPTTKTPYETVIRTRTPFQTVFLNPQELACPRMTLRSTTTADSPLPEPDFSCDA
jgi:hypothetical protein